MTDVKITSLGGYFKMEHVENGINKPVGMFIPLFVFRIYLCAAFMGREEIVLAYWIGMSDGKSVRQDEINKKYAQILQKRTQIFH